MKEILLTQGMTAIVDDEDYERLMKWKWYYNKSSASKTGYAVRNIRKQNGKQKGVRMHRVILNTPIGYDTDHINGNGLDNRKENLRVAMHSQNTCNRRKHADNTSGYKGVSWEGKREKWRAYIKFNYKTIHLGRFKDKLKAAIVYNEAAIKYHGKFACLNQIGDYYV